MDSNQLKRHLEELFGDEAKDVLAFLKQVARSDRPLPRPIKDQWLLYMQSCVDLGVLQSVNTGIGTNRRGLGEQYTIASEDARQAILEA